MCKDIVRLCTLCAKGEIRQHKTEAGGPHRAEKKKKMSENYRQILREMRETNSETTFWHVLLHIGIGTTKSCPVSPLKLTGNDRHPCCLAVCFLVWWPLATCDFWGPEMWLLPNWYVLWGSGKYTVDCRQNNSSQIENIYWLLLF